MAEYYHIPDEVDAVVLALGKLEREKGRVAARDAVPVALLPAIFDLMELEGIGFINATEIVLRSLLAVEASA